MRAPAQYSTHQGSYSQQYQFYYARNGRYCAYEPSSGTHFIHSQKNNSWRPYYPDHVSPTQQYSKSKSRRHNVTAEYQQYENEYQHVNHHNDQYMSGERGREQVRRSRREYSPTSKEAAHQSLIDESNIDMDCYSEDEGVDVRMGERSGRSRRPFRDSHRQRSRSGAELRNEKAYAREASHPRESDHRSMHYTNYHTHHMHPKQTHGYSFGSNQAGVGYEGSDHDSGLGHDSIPEPPKNMPKVFRWLNETASEYDDSWQFDAEHPARETSYIHHSEVRVKHNSQKPHHTEKLTRDHSHQRSRSPSKRLHRQDSGMGMSVVDIEIDIQMNDVPRKRYTSQSPSRSSVPNSSSQTNAQCYETGLQYDCYIDIPLPPDLPPTPSGEMILVSRSQELAAPRSIHTAESPTFRQADSIYSPTVRPSRPFHEAYNSPSMLPRAPSPPLSPPPTRARRSGERRYPF